MLKPSAAPSVNQFSIKSAICSGVPAAVKCPRAPASVGWQDSTSQIPETRLVGGAPKLAPTALKSPIRR